jgi:nucleoside-diphosphate-sugar epimerase
MKILLLGAGGFIGANLAERLVNDGQHEITALDIEREKLDETVKNGEIRFIHFDIRANEKELERLTTDHDAIIDLVAMANPSLYVSNPIDVFKLNFTENLDRRILREAQKAHHPVFHMRGVRRYRRPGVRQGFFKASQAVCRG